MTLRMGTSHGRPDIGSCKNAGVMVGVMVGVMLVREVIKAYYNYDPLGHLQTRDSTLVDLLLFPGGSEEGCSCILNFVFILRFLAGDP